MTVRPNDVPNQEKLAQTKDKRKDTDCHVVLCKAAFGCVAVGSPRHAHDSKRVHWPERCVVGCKSNQEVPEAQRFVEFATCRLRVPVVNAREQSEDSTADEHIVEVSHNEVRIVEVNVKSRHWEEHSRNTTEGEGHEEPK